MGASKERVPGRGRSRDADYARLTAAAHPCLVGGAAAAARLGTQRASERSRAADLYDQAVRMVEDAGAIGDDKARRRLLAGCQQQAMMMIALGSVTPAVAESSAEDLRRALQEIDEKL